jgi:phage-related minor tail protein
MTVTTNGHRISRDDLQAAYTRLLGEGEAQAQSAVPQILVVVGAAAMVALTVAYLAGKRRGRRRSSVLIRTI